MDFGNMAPTAIAKELGNRLKQTRQNVDLTQAELASRTGLNRRTILNAEKGNVQLNNLVAILVCLDMADHLNLFLPEQEISPLQMAKLKGRKRQRASGSRTGNTRVKEDKHSW